MKDLVDYIRFHGNITSIRDKVDKDYVWFDICQKSTYKDRIYMYIQHIFLN